MYPKNPEGAQLKLGTVNMRRDSMIYLKSKMDSKNTLKEKPWCK